MYLLWLIRDHLRWFLFVEAVSIDSSGGTTVRGGTSELKAANETRWTPVFPTNAPCCGPYVVVTCEYTELSHWVEKSDTCKRIPICLRL